MIDIGMACANHHEEREAGFLAYPVISRRSGGLSLGVNLFPDRKRCNFGCLYCEVLPFRTETRFSIARLAEELDDFFDLRQEKEFAGFPLRDITLSGNGEPTLSPALPDALELMARVRRMRLKPDVKLVLITNATRLGEPSLAGLLGRYVDAEGLEVWAKLDAGTEAGYRLIDRSEVPFDTVLSGLASFSRQHPVVIQTMAARVGGVSFADTELGAWIGRVGDICRAGGKIAAIQLYTKARPSALEGAEALSDAELREIARRTAAAFPSIPVAAYGRTGRLG